MGVRARSSGREEGPERLVQAVDDKEALLLRHREVLHLVRARAGARARARARAGASVGVTVSAFWLASIGE